MNKINYTVTMSKETILSRVYMHVGCENLHAYLNYVGLIVFGQHAPLTHIGDNIIMK